MKINFVRILIFFKKDKNCFNYFICFFIYFYIYLFLFNKKDYKFVKLHKKQNKNKQK